MNEFIAVFLGGGLGSMVRFAISRWLGSHESGFPTATFAANVLSCIVLGLAIAFFSHKTDNPNIWKSLILIGFCGGFSTFSTFSNETWELIQSGNWPLALLYTMLSVIACVAIMGGIASLTK